MQGHAAEHHEWETSPWPLVLSVGLLFLAPFAFSLYFVYDKPLMAVLSLGLGVILTVMSVAGWVSESIRGRDVHTKEPGLGLASMPYFIIAEVFIFVAFFVAYWATRLMYDAPWPPEGTPHISMVIPVIMTIILVSSSFTIHLAEGKLEHNDVRGFISWLLVTIVLGLVFMGFTLSEWSHLIGEGFTFGTNIYSSAFYSITGFHFSHVFVGLGIFIAVLLPASKGTVSKTLAKSASLYWHFVDIVWFFVVSQVYFW